MVTPFTLVILKGFKADCFTPFAVPFLLRMVFGFLAKDWWPFQVAVMVLRESMSWWLAQCEVKRSLNTSLP